MRRTRTVYVPVRRIDAFSNKFGRNLTVRMIKTFLRSYNEVDEYEFIGPVRYHHRLTAEWEGHFPDFAYYDLETQIYELDTSGNEFTLEWIRPGEDEWRYYVTVMPSLFSFEVEKPTDKEPQKKLTVDVWGS